MENAEALPEVATRARATDATLIFSGFSLSMQ